MGPVDSTTPELRTAVLVAGAIVAAHPPGRRILDRTARPSPHRPHETRRRGHPRRGPQATSGPIPRPAPRPPTWPAPSTPCSTSSRPSKTASASSWPTPRTSCAPRPRSSPDSPSSGARATSATARPSQDAMRRIGQESARMKGLVEELLLLARLDEGMPLQRNRSISRSSLDEVVEDASRPTHPRHDHAPTSKPASVSRGRHRPPPGRHQSGHQRPHPHPPELGRRRTTLPPVNRLPPRGRRHRTRHDRRRSRSRLRPLLAGRGQPDPNRFRTRALHRTSHRHRPRRSDSPPNAPETGTIVRVNCPCSLLSSQLRSTACLTKADRFAPARGNRNGRRGGLTNCGRTRRPNRVCPITTRNRRLARVLDRGPGRYPCWSRRLVR